MTGGGRRHTPSSSRACRNAVRYLGKHENIITLKDLFIREADDELYIVMELLDSDLHRIIQSKQALSEAHHRFFMHQVGRSVGPLAAPLP